MKISETLEPRGPGRRFWKDIHAQFDIYDSDKLRLLEEAASCLDTIETAQAEIREAGSFYTDRFGQPRAHPAYELIKSYRTFFARLIRELQLDIEEPPEARPPRLY